MRLSPLALVLLGCVSVVEPPADAGHDGGSAAAEAPTCSTAADCPAWLTSECRVAHCEPSGAGTVPDAGLLGCSNLGSPPGTPCDGGSCNGAGACCDAGLCY